MIHSHPLGNLPIKIFYNLKQKSQRKISNQMKFSYHDIIETVKKDSNYSSGKYRFFEDLQGDVYDGKTPESVRSRYKMSLPCNFPYWEIHHFVDFGYVSPEDWFSEEEGHHIYFTLKSLVSDEDIQSIQRDDPLHPNPSIPKYIVYSQQTEVVIGKNFGKKQLAQNFSTLIKVFVLDDEQDNFESLTWMDPTPNGVRSQEIYTYFTYKGKGYDPIVQLRKLSQLPKMLFIAGESLSTQFPKVHNTDSIVCIDEMASVGLGIAYNEATLMGNIFLNRMTTIYPTSPDFVLIDGVPELTSDYKIGKNSVFLKGSRIYSSIIEDNVTTGEWVKTASGSKLRTGCYIKHDTSISEGVEILSAQKVTANFLLINELGVNYKDFIRMWNNHYTEAHK
jgi:hypothetical protein